MPASTQGTQAWDRYAFVNNNPVRYTDPTGHMGCDPDDETCTEDRAISEEHTSESPCEMITSQSNCQQASRVLSTIVFGLDTVSGVLSVIGSGLELGGLLGGPVGEGGALGVYQVLNAAEGILGGVSAGITLANDFLITGESYITVDPRPEIVLGHDSTISTTLAIAGGADPEAMTDTLINGAVWVNDLYRLGGGESFVQTHIGLNYLYMEWGSP